MTNDFHPALKQTYRIGGMTCTDCAKSIEVGVGRLDGVTACSLNYSAAKLHVEGEITPGVVAARVRELGYQILDDTQSPPDSAPVFLQRLPSHGVAGFLKFLLHRRDTAMALAGALLILPGLLFDELLPMLGLGSRVFDVLSLAALVLAGYPVARSAWRSLRVNHQISINFLMTLAAAGAVVIGAYTEAGLVMVLFAIGEALEGYTMEHARDSIHRLMAVAPNEATVLRPCIDCAGHMDQDGYTGGPCPFCGPEEVRVPVAELRLGDAVIVKPGERIPMDGIVLAGVSAVNQAPITGESVPVDKAPDAEVFAGSINGEGALQVEVTHLAADNAISRIIQLVEDAQEQKAPAERFVDRFARWYTPAVVVLAVGVAAVPPLLFNAPFWGEQGWFYRALELLVVACPCALVISTPVTIISAIANAARNGVLIKGGVHLESLATVKAIAFDKTGTLTLGQPNLVAVRAVDCLDILSGECDRCNDLLALASAVERRSEHPMARAIVRASEERGLLTRYPVAEAVAALPGKGVSGVVDGRLVLIGSHGHFEATVAHPPTVCEELSAFSGQGYTPMLVGEAGAYRGYAVLADTIRPSSRAALAQLRQAGVQATVMLTGDDEATAQTIAAAAGISEVRAGLLPEQKVEAVRDLLREYGTVAMVGDGVNDAPALATATVGVAMGAGTAQAIETADIALMGNDLEKLAYAVRLSHAAMRTIHANIAFAIGVKLFFLAIVLLGFGTMWMAVLADVGASLLVTLNGMRLLHYKE